MHARWLVVLCVIAVGNKDDDPGMKVVLSQDAQKFAAQSGIALFETSAKENINVEEVYVNLFILSYNVCLFFTLNIFKQ